ncbi:uncharacterized protein BDR25DRAFT_286335 [Lindgomyces ingoldianus]|uniref:Uncharacterized protein n=1 Tax=Lindgomyces ingoldianus TaxID=673940 RepID=A0ACB6QVW7_9PLEO|nr:uncharacterized protein BDR25DRAFT_286335 [Lindgomyces ingoldianus]KAF2470987.1 hypothetical protein BDR25DRAFT_286335 [Lindgomyces ingoldianus]
MSIVRVPLRPGSDGDATHRPTSTTHTLVDPPSLYLEKLGMLWMKDRGEARPGITYFLERLPSGYALYQKSRPSNPQHIDKWLYGHPSRKTFDSPNRFFPHFKYLMENGGDSFGCPCTVCHAIGGVVPRFGSMTPGSISIQNRSASSRSGGSTPYRQGMPLGPVGYRSRPKISGPGADKSHVDEEGNPDVIRNLINKLKRQGHLDDSISEPMSLDWRAEQGLLPQLLKSIKKQPQYKPRPGEIVLFVRELPAGTQLTINRSVNKIMIWDPSKKEYCSSPVWEAGVVGQASAETCTGDFYEDELGNESNVSNSGMRVEPLPDLSSESKSVSKNYVYVPLLHTRPFVLWNTLLSETLVNDLHPTIRNALTVMSSISLVGKYRFKGNWPEADIYCHGLYIGSELITVGDTVRLGPRLEDTTCSEVLVITSIRLRLSNLDLASDNDFDEGRPYNTTAYLFGKGFTIDKSHSKDEWLVDGESLSPVLNSYTEAGSSLIGLSWYPLHPPGRDIQIHYSRIVGRVFEPDALTFWIPTFSRSLPHLGASLSVGLPGLEYARDFSRKHDTRITREFGSRWFWAESRSDALGLETVNGLEVDKFDPERDPKQGRKLLKAIEGEMPHTSKGKRRHQLLSGSGPINLRGFMAPTMLPHQPESSEMDTNTEEASSGEGRRQKLITKKRAKSFDLGSGIERERGQKKLLRKRAKVVDLSSDSEEEMEIREHMRIVESIEDGPGEWRKQKVEVRI